MACTKERRPGVLGGRKVSAGGEREKADNGRNPRCAIPGSQRVEDGVAHVIMTILFHSSRIVSGTLTCKDLAHKDEEWKPRLGEVSVGSHCVGNIRGTHLDSGSGALEIEGNAVKSFQTQDDAEDQAGEE